jgi:hypothetical protein
VYVGRVGNGTTGKVVIIGSSVVVGWSKGVWVWRGVGGTVGVRVESVFRLNRLRVRKEAATRMNTTPAAPPMIHGSQSVSFRTISLKLDGTEIRTTVVLS